MSTNKKNANAGKCVENAPDNNMLNAAFEEYKKRVFGTRNDALKGVAGEMPGIKTPFARPGSMPDFSSMPFMSASGAPPYPGTMPPPPVHAMPFAGGPPPMPGIAPTQPEMPKTVKNGIVPQMGNMMKLGMDVVNASLSTWLKVMENFSGTESECSLPHSSHGPSGCGSYDHHHYEYDHGGDDYCHSSSSCCEPDTSCCSCSCGCKPNVNGCC